MLHKSIVVLAGFGAMTLVQAGPAAAQAGLRCSDVIHVVGSVMPAPNSPAREFSVYVQSRSAERIFFNVKVASRSFAYRALQPQGFNVMPGRDIQIILGTANQPRPIDIGYDGNVGGETDRVQVQFTNCRTTL